MRKALPHDSSEPVCQSGIRSAGSRARSPTFPHPARALRAPGIFGVICAVSSCAPGLHVPRASTGSGGHLWESAPEGEEATQPGSCCCYDIPAGAHPCWRQDTVAQPKFSAPWEGSVVRSLEREAAAAHSTYCLASCFSSLHTRERHNSIISSKCNTALTSFALEPTKFRRLISQFSNIYLSLQSQAGFSSNY